MSEDNPTAECCPICKDEKCKIHLLGRFDESGDEGELGVGLIGGPQARNTPQHNSQETAMAKANKRVTARKKSLKRGKATTKPASKTAKCTPAKKSKSKVRRVGTEVVTDADAKLEDMSLAECIAAVAVDVASKRDDYRSIDPHELAERLGIDDADKPGGDWSFVWYVIPRPIEDIFDYWGDEAYFLGLLQPHVTTERYEELKLKIELAPGKRLHPKSLDFLTEVEKQTIVRLDMEREAKNTCAPRVLAYYYINAPHGRTLTFEAYIEDDGGRVDLKTPYDERDGKFTDLSDCLIVEDRR